MDIVSYLSYVMYICLAAGEYFCLDYQSFAAITFDLMQFHLVEGEHTANLSHS